MQTTLIINSKNIIRLLMLVAVFCALGMMGLRSQASTPQATVTISNNSGWELRYIYLSPTDNDNWGDDQLNGTIISPGTTRALNVSWEQPTVKLIAEDQDGCFLTTTVDAASNSEWTITNSSQRNCGG